MNDKERQELLDQALDRINSGALGQKNQAYWNKIAAISSTRSSDVRAKAMKSIDWDKRNKALSKSRKGKLNIGLQKHNNSIRIPVNAFKVTHNGKKKQNFKILTKEFIGTYESITAASKELKISTSIIHNILNPNNRIFQVKGFLFEYT